LDNQGDKYMKYGTRLRGLIESYGLKQSDIALKINVSKSTVSFWINAEYPPLEGIEKICAVLGIPVYQFFMSEKDIENFMGVDPEWLEMGKAIQPLPDSIKNYTYKAIYQVAETVYAALTESSKPD